MLPLFSQSRHRQTALKPYLSHNGVKDLPIRKRTNKPLLVCPTDNPCDSYLLHRRNLLNLPKETIPCRSSTQNANVFSQASFCLNQQKKIYASRYAAAVKEEIKSTTEYLVQAIAYNCSTVMTGGLFIAISLQMIKEAMYHDALHSRRGTFVHSILTMAGLEIILHRMVSSMLSVHAYLDQRLEDIVWQRAYVEDLSQILIKKTEEQQTIAQKKEQSYPP